MKGSFELIWADNGCVIIEEGKTISVVENAVLMDHGCVERRIGEIFTDIERNSNDYIQDQMSATEDIGGFRVDFTMTPIKKIGNYEDI